MPEGKGELREINYRQLLPWTELFRTFSVALDLRKLLLAAAAILLLSVGWNVLALVFSPHPDKKPKASDYPLEAYRKSGDTDEAAKLRADRALHKDQAQYEQRLNATRRFQEWPWQTSRGPNPFLTLTESGGRSRLFSYPYWRERVPTLMEPLTKFLAPVRLLVQPNAGFLSTLFALLGILWTLLIWGVFGGAIARIAAVQIARREKIGMMEALRFSAGKLLALFTAPLFPFAALIVIAICMMLGGVVLHINWVGDLLSTALWPLALLGGFVMAVILMGFIGWPLMYCTISTEGSDSFDAISRSYSYVYQRPWHYAFYGLVAAAYGVLTIFFVVFVTSMFVYLAKWGVGLTPWLEESRDYRLTTLFRYAPESYEWRRLLTYPLTEKHLEEIYNGMDWAQHAGAGLVGFWLVLVFLLMLGYVYSYFWSASTMIYFLLRKNVDDTDMDEVFIEEEEERFGQPPPAAPASAPSAPTTLPMGESMRPPAPSTPEPPPAAPGDNPPPAAP